MTTVFSTGPGFYEVATHETDPSIKPGVMRIYCARLEAYDLDAKDDLEKAFTILAAKAEDDPRVAKALLGIGKHVEGNRQTLEDLAKR